MGNNKKLQPDIADMDFEGLGKRDAKVTQRSLKAFVSGPVSSALDGFQPFEIYLQQTLTSNFVRLAKVETNEIKRNRPLIGQIWRAGPGCFIRGQFNTLALHTVPKCVL